MDISKLPIEELISLRDKINSHINNLNDGYVYICEVFSDGGSWIVRDITNKYVLQNLCNKYNGENGFVNVYSTNPTLNDLKNNGNTLYIVSAEDYHKWVVWQELSNKVATVNHLLRRWDYSSELPDGNKPSYPPPFTEEDIARYNKELEECDMNFIHPVPYDIED